MSNGIRQRAPGSDGPAPETPTQPPSQEPGKPGPASPIMERVGPLVVTAIGCVDKMSPFLIKGYEVGSKFYTSTGKPLFDKYYNDDIARIIFGLLLTFYGGNFAVTLACYAALKISGWPLVVDSWEKIKVNIQRAYQVFKDDSELRGYLDKDGDGQISAGEVRDVAMGFLEGDSSKKLEIVQAFAPVLRAVDPQQIGQGVGGIWASALTVMATLRSQFAKAVSLGVNLGQILYANIRKYLEPSLKKRMSADNLKWGRFVVECICKFVGVSLALFLQRAVSAFHSAMQGGRILAVALMRTLIERQLVSRANEDLQQDAEDNDMTTALQYIVGIWGFWTQLSGGFTMGWIMTMVLLPLVMVENVLTYVAAWGGASM